jgi:fructose-bisphosphate aldolase class I
MDIWRGDDKNVKAAQKLLYKRASLDNAARRGEYKPAMEEKRP